MRDLQAAGGATLNASAQGGEEQRADGGLASVAGVPAGPAPSAAGGSAPAALVSIPTVLVSRRRATFLLALAAVLVVVADQVTKHLTVVLLSDRPPVRLIGSTVELVDVRNSGAAFSVGSDHTFVFPLITLAVVGWICWMAVRLRSVPWAVALGLVLGGALGNLIDRIFREPGPFLGHVVDMIKVGWWPVFNLADSSLVCGVLLAVLLELTGRRRDGTRVSAASQQAQRTVRD